MRQLIGPTRFALALAAVMAIALASPAAPFAAETKDAAKDAAKETKSNDLIEALLGGKFDFYARLRFEYVDQDTKVKKAKASTLKTQFGYMTGAFYGVSLYAQGEDVRVLGAETFNDSLNGRTKYPVVADPRNTKLNQAFIQYQSPFDTLAKVGRQRITLDNHRWVGNVVFRQNEQTYDAVRLANTSLPDTTVEYMFVNKVHRIFTDRSVTGLYPMKSHLLRAEYKGFKPGTLIGYAYLLDFNRPIDRGLSSASVGLRFTGSQALDEDWKALYTAEYARQVDYANNPRNFGLNYFLIEPGVSYGPVTGKLGYEVLEGNGTNALQTPLATGHAFQGWADQFLTTPANGIDDFYVLASAKVLGVAMTAVYHNFDANKGSAHYGDEVDAVAAYTFLEHFTVELKYANYMADTFSLDTKKYWASFIVKY
ncbi:MAG: alginate export family protein [Alphaproteobacteria bacterium]